MSKIKNRPLMPRGPGMVDEQKHRILKLAAARCLSHLPENPDDARTVLHYAEQMLDEFIVAEHGRGGP